MLGIGGGSGGEKYTSPCLNKKKKELKNKSVPLGQVLARAAGRVPRAEGAERAVGMEQLESAYRRGAFEVSWGWHQGHREQREPLQPQPARSRKRKLFGVLSFLNASLCLPGPGFSERTKRVVETKNIYLDCHATTRRL